MQEARGLAPRRARKRGPTAKAINPRVRPLEVENGGQIPARVSGSIQLRRTRPLRGPRISSRGYNDAHHHSGLTYLTPADVHHGRATTMLEVRHHTCPAAYHAHPERFVQEPPRLRLRVRRPAIERVVASHS